jgi:hypothetical protein
MQRPSEPIRARLILVALCMALASIAVAFATTASAHDAAGTGAIKGCKHRYAGKGKKGRQAERRCIGDARKRQKRKRESHSHSPESPAPTSTGTPNSSTSSSSGGDTAAPSGPSTPTGPSGPEAPAPLKLEASDAVVTGSAVSQAPPAPLTSFSTIELTAGSESGVTTKIEGGGLVISASAQAATGSLHLTISGTGCTATECGRQFLISLRLTVQPGGPPSVTVTPNGPTSGPAGFGPNVVTPDCSYLRVGFDDGSFYSISSSSSIKAFNTHTPVTFSAGSHRMSFECLTGTGGGVVWTSPGFEVTITSASIPLGMESTTVPAGGEIVFTTGPSLSATPCPTLPGVSVVELLFFLNPSTGASAAHRSVPMPDGLATEGMTVPLGTAEGVYTVRDRCMYRNVAGEGAMYEFGRTRGNLIVTAT